MANFITGLFTLLAALSGICLKDHLDHKKSIAMTRKQKAVEAYALAGKLMHSLNTLKVICSNLIQDKNYSYIDMYNNDPTINSDILEKLELLIVENFYDLKSNAELLEVEATINSYNCYLYNIIITTHSQEFKLNSETFTNETKKRDISLVNSCHKLRSSLIDKYINIQAPKTTVYSLAKSAKQHIKCFFTK